MGSFGAYHGSQVLFEKFDLSFAKTGTKIECFGRGVYVTDCIDNAANYARRCRFWLDGRLILSDTYDDRGPGTGNYHADCLLIRFQSARDALAWLESDDRETPYGWEDVDFASVTRVMRGLVGRVTFKTVGYRYRVRVDADRFLNLDEDLPPFLATEVDALPVFCRANASFHESLGVNPRICLVMAVFRRRANRGRPLEAELSAQGYHGVRFYDHGRRATEWTIFDPSRVCVESVENLFPQAERLAA